VGLSRLIYGAGRFPDGLRAELEAERIEQIEEEMFGTITLRHYKGPRERSGLSKQPFRGALAVTRKRLVVWSDSKAATPWYGTQVDVPFDDPRYRRLEIAAEHGGDRLLIATNLEEYNDDRSGRFEIRFRTPRATELAEFALAGR
jgi:hypothetical protein